MRAAVIALPAGAVVSRRDTADSAAEPGGEGRPAYRPALVVRIKFEGQVFALCLGSHFYDVQGATFTAQHT